MNQDFPNEIYIRSKLKDNIDKIRLQRIKQLTRSKEKNMWKSRDRTFRNTWIEVSQRSTETNNGLRNFIKPFLRESLDVNDYDGVIQDIAGLYKNHPRVL